MKRLILLAVIILSCSQVRNIPLIVELPKTNRYMEKTSSDGYSFIGLTLAINKKNYDWYLEKTIERDYTNGGWVSRGVQLNDTTHLVYNAWSSFLFLRYINCDLNPVLAIIDRAGCYPSGMVKYTDFPEIYYVVPNMTSAAAHIYAGAGQIEKANRLLKVLAKRQSNNGNWNYATFPDKNDLTKEYQIGTQEDGMHLALMVYQLRETRKIPGVINIDEMYLRALFCLECLVSNSQKLQQGSIGWAVPMIYLVLKNVNNKTIEKYRKETVKYLNHPNFRVRAYAAWALAERGQNEKIGIETN